MDKFNDHTGRLYAVYERQYTGGKINAQYFTPGIMADEMKRVFPEVEYASGFRGDVVRTFQAGDKTLKEQGAYADSDFLKMFSYKLLAGDRASALSAPSDIVISKKLAYNLFGDAQNAIGKTVRYENRKDFRVTGVFETLPKNASEKFEYLLNWKILLEDSEAMRSWGNNGVGTFLMLKPGTDPVAFEKQITGFLAKYNTYEGDFRIELALQRFDEMYLHSNFNARGQLDGGRIEYVRLFSIVAVFILLIACINFMNLTTAHSIKRAKEIGVRKVAGALRSALILQFIAEAVMLVFISMIIALAFVALLIPVFNGLTQKQISLPVSDLSFWAAIAGITLITGMIAGSYPALFLSSFKPVSVLKGALKLNGGNVSFRKALVVFQFILSIVLIIGSIIVSDQVNYIQTRNLGFNRENLIYVPQEGELNQKYTVFKEEALKIPGVQSVSRTEQAPTNITTATWGIDWEGKDPDERPTFSYAGVGYDFAKTMNIEVLKGRDFSKDFVTDQTGYILNEEAAKQVGYEEPVGKSFTMWDRKATIIGVVKNFHFRSLHEPVKPMVLWLGENNGNGNILIRTEPGKTREALQGIQKLSGTMNPGFPFTYKFADEEYAALYRSEQMAGSLADCFAFLAIFISCLGLLGLALFTAEQRKKEIGIRKVLGASVAGITGILSGDFLKLVGLSALIAFPVGWWATDNWLQSFAYRVPVDWSTFLAAGCLALFIALATISFQTIKAALMNPVKSLRSE